jgi:hypothetical protein
MTSPEVEREIFLPIKYKKRVILKIGNVLGYILKSNIGEIISACSTIFLASKISPGSYFKQNIY